MYQGKSLKVVINHEEQVAELIFDREGEAINKFDARTVRARARHLRQRLRQVRPPVPHPDVHGQRQTAFSESRLEPRSLGGRDRRDGRDAAEPFVVVRHGLDALGGQPPGAEDVLKEGPDVAGAERTAERNQQHGIEGKR